MNYKEVALKWQKKWKEKNYFLADNNSNKEKYYILVEFPYPSGAGLHVGHVKSYSALDAMSRMKRMQGYNVLFPMGWDAFGLPAEQYAIKNKVHPSVAVKENVKTFKTQLEKLGLSFDWSREFSTTDPEYYKWTQWQFLKFYENDMAYKDKKEINWCNNCKVGLSNEESEGGVCERCSGPVVKKEKEQWILKMSKYADKLLTGLDDTDFIDRVKNAQVNWIGKSVGAEVDFKIENAEEKITVFTTRPDTLYGATFMVLSPEHSILERYKNQISNYEELVSYKEEAKKKSEIERTDATKEKTGVKIEGLNTINPVNGQQTEIWISDYVLMNYGTGAIMAVPAHDERDYEFAKKFGISIIPVIEGGDIEKEAYTGDGIHINSDILNGLNKEEAINKISEYLEENKLGIKKTNYKLQDWIFSRQRFWGEPIPMIHCEECGWVPVPEKDLPVLLPNVTSYEPTDDGESPLANIEEFVNTTCPKCGKPAKRETDTMPNWAGSSWYYLRYMDPTNKDEFVSKEALKYWNMVDYYNGGMEHATRHLLYARFWHRFFYDIGEIPYSEPFKKRVAHGMILGEGNEKMSKSKGNVINPDDMIEIFGVDALRVYELFIGDYEKDASWSDNGLKGAKRFIEKVIRIKDKVNLENNSLTENFVALIHKTIKKVTNDLSTMNYNTAVSSLMILSNEYDKYETISKADYEILLTLLYPMAPHVCEELNEEIGNQTHIAATQWPVYDESKTVDNITTIGVQVNGKLRGEITINKNEDKEEIIKKAKESENVQKFLTGMEIVKEIVVPGKIVNIVVK
ncbi:MAG: leucine--tRNA ligase [bacterium]